jgi:hypothetical protein
LDSLEIADAFPELLPLFRVVQCGFERAARDSDHLRADTDASFVQSFDGDFIAFAEFSEHVLLRHFAIFENQFRGRRGANAELVFLLADSKSFEAFLDDEGRDAAITGFGICVSEQHEDFGFLAVRNPEFAAVDNKMIAGIDRARLHGEGIGTRSRFAQRIGADFLSR